MRPLRRLTGVGENAFLTSIGIFSLGALMMGCSGTPDDVDGTTSGSTDTSTAPTTTAETSDPTGDPTGATTADTGTTDDPVDPNEVYNCAPGIPVTTQAGFLLNREYDKMVEDLLGVTGVEADGNQAPSRLL